MDLYFVRHGDATTKAGWHGTDSEKPLSPEGITRAREMAAALAALRPGVGLILTSPLERARRTAEIFARALKPAAGLRTDDRLAPGFGRDKLAELIRENAGTAALMLVGHEPDFSTTVGACIGGGRVEFKKGALARLEIEESPALKGTLAWLVPPGVLSR